LIRHPLGCFASTFIMDNTNNNEEYYGTSADSKNRDYHPSILNIDNDDNDNSSSTGRWTDEEHEAFLQGLRAHGRNWKQVATFIPSRTIVQIRTHAQKYFAKLTKAGIPFDEHGSLESISSGTTSTTTLSINGPSGSIVSYPHTMDIHNISDNTSNRRKTTKLNYSRILNQSTNTVTTNSTTHNGSIKLVNNNNHSRIVSHSNHLHQYHPRTIDTTNTLDHDNNHHVYHERILSNNNNDIDNLDYHNLDNHIMETLSSSDNDTSSVSTSSGTSVSDDDDEDISPMHNQSNNYLSNNYSSTIDNNNPTVVRIKARRGSRSLSITSASEIPIQEIDSALLLENDSVGDLEISDRLLVFSDTSEPPTPIMSGINNRLQRLSGSPVLGPSSPLSISGRKRSGSGFTNINNASLTTTGLTNSPRITLTSLNPPTNRLVRSVSGPSTSSSTLSLGSSNIPISRTPTLLSKQNSLSKLVDIDNKGTLSSSSAAFALPPATMNSNTLLSTSSLFSGSTTSQSSGLTNVTGILSTKSASTITSTFQFLNEGNSSSTSLSRPISPNVGTSAMNSSTELTDDDLHPSITITSYNVTDVPLPSFNMINSYGISTLNTPSTTYTNHNNENNVLDSMIRTSSLLEEQHQQQHDENIPIMSAVPSSPFGNRIIPLVPPPTQNRLISNSLELMNGVPMNQLANALLRLPQHTVDNNVASSNISTQSYSSGVNSDTNMTNSRSTNSPSTANTSVRSISPVTNNVFPNLKTIQTGLGNCTVDQNHPSSMNNTEPITKLSINHVDSSSSTSSPSRYTVNTTRTNRTTSSTIASEMDMEGGDEASYHTSSLSIASGGISHRSSFDGSTPRRNRAAGNPSHQLTNNPVNTEHMGTTPNVDMHVPISKISQLTPGVIHVPPSVHNKINSSSTKSGFRVGNVRIAAIVTTQLYSPLVTELADEGLERLAYTNNSILQKAMANNRSQPLAPSQCTLVTRTIMDNNTKQPATTVSIIPTVNINEEQRKDNTVVPFTGTGICVGAVPVQLPHGPFQYVRVPIPDHLQPHVPYETVINNDKPSNTILTSPNLDLKYNKGDIYNTQTTNKSGTSKNTFDLDAFFS